MLLIIRVELPETSGDRFRKGFGEMLSALLGDQTDEVAPQPKLKEKNGKGEEA